MLSLALFLLVAAQSGTAGSQAADTSVVVTGERRVAALKLCLERNCPPAEEVEAAMEAGAELFRRGNYRESQNVLSRAIARNAKYTAELPGKMSDLYATYADVASHQGAIRWHSFAAPIKARRS